MTSLRLWLCTALLTASLATLTACVSQIPRLTDYADSIVGRPIAELQEREAQPQSYSSWRGRPPREYALPSGNWVHVHPDRDNCDVHFEVNPDGIVVGYTLEGTGCRYQ